MKWKAILAVLLLLGIFGLFFAKGKTYIDLLSRRVGEFVDIILRKPPSGLFSFSLTTEKETFYGQKYKLHNFTFSFRGLYNSLKVDGRKIGLKEEKEIEINLKGSEGSFELMNDGNIRIECYSEYIEIDNVIFSEVNSKIEMEAPISNFLITGIEKDEIILQPVKGSIKIFRNNLEPSTINVEGERVEIKNFYGKLNLNNEECTLLGDASSIKGKNFSFTSSS
ncbi:MAG: hypothetical protein QXX38_01680 [Candidatus Aenigmatarchaeota archaeon]